MSWRSVFVMSHSPTTTTNSTHETLTPNKGAKVEAEETLANAVVEVSQVTAEQPRQSIRVYIPGWYSEPRRRSW